MLDAKPGAETTEAAFVAEDPVPVAAASGKKDKLEVDRYFEALVKLNGSDLHLKSGQPPYMRVKGALQPLKAPPISAEKMQEICFPMLDDRQRRILAEEGGADFAHSAVVDGTKWRFRVNLLYQQGALGMVARKVNNTIPDFEKLFLPPAIEQLCTLEQGMVLLAGVTGSGKSTTIGSMLNYINRNYRKHILTLEDPIEFVFTEDKCLINQREIGTDVKNFEIGMKHAVREDPISSSSVSFVTSIPSRQPSMPLRRGILSTARSTPRTPRARSLASSTCFRRKSMPPSAARSPST